MENRPLKVEEKSFSADDVSSALKRREQAMDASSSEPEYALYVIPNDPVCGHMIQYIEKMGFDDAFEVIDAGKISKTSRPDWLTGAPILLDVQANSISCGDDAVYVLRDVIEGPSHTPSVPAEDLMVVSSHGAGTGLGFAAGGDIESDDDDETPYALVQRILQIETNRPSAADDKSSGDDMKKMINARLQESDFSSEHN
jgi:hypothetical protein